MRKRTITAIALASLLTACAYNRDTPGDYDLVSTSQIRVERLPVFKDCVNDAFRDRPLPMGIWVNLKNRQQIRSNMTRIELVHSESGPMLSADIYPDGKAQLFEQSLKFRLPYDQEKAAYQACVDANK